MQDTAILNPFSKDPSFASIPSSSDDSETSKNVMENENMLLKAQFFCRIGMGPRFIQSMTKENQQRITTYYQEKVAQSEENSPATTECTSTRSTMSISKESSEQDLEDEEEIETDQSPEEWVKRNLMKRNMLLKVQMLSRMGMANQTLDALSPKDKARMTKYHEQRTKEFDSEDSSDEESLNKDLTIERSYTNADGDFSINFLGKTDAQVRSCYYNKLISMKILPTAPTKKNQSIIIYDWDDTLLCTTYLVQLGLKSVTSSVKSVIKPLDETSSQLLEKSVESGQVFIITNAEEGWVQYSAQVFMPKTWNVIKSKRITVISARSNYQQQFPKDCKRWKKEAFKALVKDFKTDIVTNLVAIGDSHIEIDAAHVLAKQFDKAIIKTIKFKELPQPEELSKQQALVFEKFDSMFVSLKDLTIRLEKKSS